MKISDIIHYPVKSLSGNQLKSSEIHERGLKDDRRFMLIDDNNTFVSQRKYPLLSQIDVGITEENIVLRDRRTNFVIKQELQFELKKTEVSIWRTLCTSHRFLKPDLDQWISEQIGASLRFVYMDESDHRPINPKYSQSEDEIVSFADGYPILVTNTASLKDLNDQLRDPISMEHFRPNLVIEHTKAWDEDNWKKLRIGEVILRIPKPCARCKVINIDPITGEKGSEVLQTLAKIRMPEGGIYFGLNAIVEKTGKVRLGDKVEIV
jgi:uncharacterized protein YcbX